jgi:hypothetical protein
VHGRAWDDLLSAAPKCEWAVGCMGAAQEGYEGVDRADIGNTMVQTDCAGDDPKLAAH